MPGERKMVSSGELAKILGKTERTVQILAKAGTITAEKYKGKNLYDLYSVIQEYIDNSAKSDSNIISSNDEAKLREEIRIKRAKADILEMERGELDGQMHSADDVESMTTDLVFSVRSSMLSLPGILSVRLANEDSVEKCSEIIKKEIFQILEDLSRYEYDPEEYKKRVRERQGWKEITKDDDEEDGE